MKKIINGKMYNTNTAKSISEYENNYSPADFSYFRETLYKKKTGEYFIYGTGNANSKYAESRGNNTYAGGSEIRSVTEDEARKFVEEYGTVEEYEEEFGEVEE